ncbi:MAG TPA: hypothetical protein DCY35_09585 [Prolixibacteraceae bacterium]|nr:hypothetical protein [Prolixibacteraceae bacterium]
MGRRPFSRLIFKFINKPKSGYKSMSKKKNFADPRQKELDFYNKIKAYQGLKEEILNDLPKSFPT